MGFKNLGCPNSTRIIHPFYKVGATCKASCAFFMHLKDGVGEEAGFPRKHPNATPVLQCCFTTATLLRLHPNTSQVHMPISAVKPN
jgi:hypothetical protein